MQTTISQLRKAVFIVISLGIALGANVAYGQWANPTANPPADNAPVPINVGSAEQYKAGNLQADQFHSNNYCDADGGNCVTAAAVGGGDPYRCQTRSYLRNVQFAVAASNNFTGCARGDWSCLTSFCQSIGYTGREGSAAWLSMNSSWMQVFSCYRWVPLVYCGNY